MNLAERVRDAVMAAVPGVTDVSIGNGQDKSTWTVTPPQYQAAAAAAIAAFNANDPAHVAAAFEQAAKDYMDQRREFAALVWVILKQMYPSDTDAQLRTKFGVARTRVIDAYRDRPWIA